jgi:hypothetical protein
MFFSNCKVSRVRQALDNYSSNELTSAATNDDNYMCVCGEEFHSSRFSRYSPGFMDFTDICPGVRTNLV